MTRTIRMFSFSLLGLTLVACIGASPARPRVMNTTVAPGDAIDRAIRVLAKHGLAVDHVDDRAGIIHSEWQATDFRYGSTEYDSSRYITRRFTITVAPQGSGSEVAVRVEDMACADPSAFIQGDAGHADCQAVNGIVPPDQQTLDEIARDLAGAFGMPPASASAP